MIRVSKFVVITWEFLKVLAVILAATLLARHFLIQPFFVEGLSMAPNFFDGELLLFEKVSYRFAEPRRGDVITLKAPFAGEPATLLKRIIALPGETISISNGRVRINNRSNPESLGLDESPYTRQLTYPNITLTLQENEFFVMGDNRAYSSDSREFGPIKENQILGRVRLSVFPLNHFRIIQ